MTPQYFLPSLNRPGSLWVFNELEGEDVWRIKICGKDPRDENEEGTQLGCDEWGTEWKHHGSKAIYCYKNQIPNRNCKGNVTKERDELTQGLGPVSLKPRY